MAEYINLPSRNRGGFLRNIAEVGFIKTLTWAVRSQISTAVQAQLQREIATGFGIKHPVTTQQMDVNQGYVFAVTSRAGGMAARVEPILELHQRGGRGQPPSKNVIHDHPLLDLLKQPNSDENGAEFIWKAMGLLQTAGRLYFKVSPNHHEFSLPKWEIKVRDQSPGNIRILEPDRVLPLVTKERWGAGFQYNSPLGIREFYPGAPWDAASREEWKRNPYEFVFRVNIPSVDSYDGQSPTQAASNAINILQGLNKLHQNQLYNGIHSGLIFYLLQNVQSVERFTEGVLMVRQGLGKAGEPLILPKGTVEVEKSPLGNTEMAFGDLKREALRELLAVMGASEGLLGRTENVNRSVIEGLERMFALGNIDPKLALIAHGINTWLLPLYHGQSSSAWYRLRFPSAAASDELTVMDRLSKGVLNSILTPNEARAEIGYKPHPDGDKLIVGIKQDELQQKGDIASQSLEIQQQAIDMKAQADLLKGDLMLKQIGGASPTSEMGAKQPESASSSKQTNKPIGNTEASIKRLRARLPKGHMLHSPDARAARWKEVMRERAPLERELRKRMSSVFRMWEADAVESVKKGLNGRAQEDAQWRPLLERRAKSWALAVAVQAARQALEKVGLSPDLVTTKDAYLQAWSVARGARLAQTVIRMLQEETSDVLSAGIMDKLPPKEIAAAVAEVFPSMDSALTRRIAAGEATAALGAGVAHAARIAEDMWATDTVKNDTGRSIEFGGIFDFDDEDEAAASRTGLLWIAPPDTRSGCIAHRILDGYVAPTGTMFKVGSAELAFTGDEPNVESEISLEGCRCHNELVLLADI